MKIKRILFVAVPIALGTFALPLSSHAALSYHFASIAATPGNLPYDGLVADRQGNLYGTTRLGGTFNDGVIFEVAVGSHAVTTLASFNSSNGAAPTAGMVFDSAGDLYGTASGGGANGDGTLYELASGSHSITDVVDFNTSTGTVPHGQLGIDSSGNLFGTTSGPGAAFKYAPSAHAFTNLGPASVLYEGAMVDSAGNAFFGTRDGAIDKVAPGATGLTRIGTVVGAASTNPEGVLVEDSQGNLYGTTDGGGTNGAGTVFELVAGASSTVTIGNLSAGSPTFSLSNLNAGLIMDSAGDLFGTASSAGADNDGIVYEIPAGTTTVTTLYTFTGGTDGSYPDGPLLLDSAGDLFGTTGSGNNVFELSVVPEPSTISMLALTFAGLLRRRVRPE